MIIAIAGPGGVGVNIIVAQNMALLRARAGRRVLLVDADPGQRVCRWARRRWESGLKPNLLAESIPGGELGVRLESLQRRCHDIVIHTDGRDSPASRAALIAARTVVVPVLPGQADLERQYQLVARLNAARMFNPDLRVLFVVMSGCADPSGNEVAALRNYVAHVMSASLAGTVIHAGGSEAADWSAGLCVCEAPERDARAAAEMKELYREIFVLGKLACAA